MERAALHHDRVFLVLRECNEGQDDGDATVNAASLGKTFYHLGLDKRPMCVPDTVAFVGTPEALGAAGDDLLPLQRAVGQPRTLLARGESDRGGQLSQETRLCQFHVRAAVRDCVQRDGDTADTRLLGRGNVLNDASAQQVSNGELGRDVPLSAGDQERATKDAFLVGDTNESARIVAVDEDEWGNVTAAPQLPEFANEASGVGNAPHPGTMGIDVQKCITTFVGREPRLHGHDEVTEQRLNHGDQDGDVTDWRRDGRGQPHLVDEPRGFPVGRRGGADEPVLVRHDVPRNRVVAIRSGE